MASTPVSPAVTVIRCQGPRTENCSVIFYIHVRSSASRIHKGSWRQRLILPAESAAALEKRGRLNAGWRITMRAIFTAVICVFGALGCLTAAKEFDKSPGEEFLNSFAAVRHPSAPK